MVSQPTEAVIAGSKAFALALLAPLTERVGTRPRIAADPAQALRLSAAAGLVVVEFQGDRSLDAIRQLLAESAGVSVIAAVSGDHAAAEAALRALGVEAAPWDGNPEAVLSAVSRHLAGAPLARAPAGAAQEQAMPAPAALRSAAGAGVGTLFEDLSLDGAPGAEASPADVTAPLPRPPAGGDAGAWPSTAPSASEASAALAQGLRGVFAPAGAPLAVVAEVMAGMSPLEKAVLLREPVPVDGEPIRRAAVMRVRVAAALAVAPGPGSPVDADAVSALLADIDALLADVNRLVASAPPEVQGALEAVRNAVVKEAIDFSEAAHAISEPAPSGQEAHPPAHHATAAARAAARTRIRSVANEAERELERGERRRSRRLYAGFAVACIVAAAFHGYRYMIWRAAASLEPPTRAGAPANARVLPAASAESPVVVHSKDGSAFTAEQLKRMEEEELLRGNTIRPVSPSVVVVVPGRPGGPVPGPSAGR